MVIVIILAIYFDKVPSINFTAKEASTKDVLSISNDQRVSPKANLAEQHENSKKEEANHLTPTTKAPAERKENLPVVTPNVPSSKTRSQTQAKSDNEMPVARKRTQVRKIAAPQAVTQAEFSQRTAAEKRNENVTSNTDDRSRSTDSLMTMIQNRSPQAVDPNLLATGSKIDNSKPSGE
jgi:hypothetical protein